MTTFIDTTKAAYRSSTHWIKKFAVPALVALTATT